MNRAKRLLNTVDLVARGAIERSIPFWPTEWIDRLQRYRLRAIIYHAYDTVPFYRQVMNERGLHPSDFRTVEDLSKLPLIDGLTLEHLLFSHFASVHSPADGDSWEIVN